MLLGTSPGGVNVWSAVRSALVSWYSGIRGWREGNKEGGRGRERRWGGVGRVGGGLFYIMQLSSASILIMSNPY